MNKNQINKIWENCSYENKGGVKRMTQIGFLQAIQELGIKITEEKEVSDEKIRHNATNY